jgi:hypothetical protein
VTGVQTCALPISAALTSQGANVVDIATQSLGKIITRFYDSGGIHFGTVGQVDPGANNYFFDGKVLARSLAIQSLNTAPATSNSAGTTGQISIDANFIYVCVATNTWKRVALSTW